MNTTSIPNATTTAPACQQEEQWTVSGMATMMAISVAGMVFLFAFYVLMKMWWRKFLRRRHFARANYSGVAYHLNSVADLEDGKPASPPSSSDSQNDPEVASDDDIPQLTLTLPGNTNAKPITLPQSPGRISPVTLLDRKDKNAQGDISKVRLLSQPTSHPKPGGIVFHRN